MAPDTPSITRRTVPLGVVKCPSVGLPGRSVGLRGKSVGLQGARPNWTRCRAGSRSSLDRTPTPRSTAVGRKPKAGEHGCGSLPHISQPAERPPADRGRSVLRSKLSALQTYRLRWLYTRSHVDSETSERWRERNRTTDHLRPGRSRGQQPEEAMARKRRQPPRKPTDPPLKPTGSWAKL